MDEINITENGGEKTAVAGSPTGPSDTKPTIHDIPIEKIRVNEFWIRSDWQDDLDSLAESIEADGFLQFPGVRDNGDGTYTIVFGHRRYWACKQSGRTTLPCYIIDASAEKAAILMLIENIDRRQLRPVDEARTIRQIADRFDLTEAELARRMKRPRNVVNERLAILALPDEMLEKIAVDSEGCINFTHAVTLSRLWDDRRSDRQSQVRKLFEKTIRHALSTTELKALVALFKEGDFDRLPDRLRTALLSNKWMTAAMAGLFLSPHEAVVGEDPRAKAMRAAAKRLSRDELEDLIVRAVEAGWTYEKTRDKLLKALGQRLTVADPLEAEQRSSVDRLFACVSALDQQLAASQDEIEGLARSNPKELGAVWFAIVQLQKKLQPVATLMGEAVNGLNPDRTAQDEETANVDAG
jgi:ParB/RepB/Spo0J family partition protein